MYTDRRKCGLKAAESTLTHRQALQLIFRWFRSNFFAKKENDFLQNKNNFFGYFGEMER